MNRTDALNYVNQQQPTFLQKAKNKGWICPNCGNGSGKDATGIVLDPKTKRHPKYKCFVCNISGDIIDLIGLAYGITDDKDKFNQAYSYYGLDVDETDVFTRNKTVNPPQPEDKPDEEEMQLGFILQAMKHKRRYEYLMSRGISESVQDRFYIGYCDNWVSPKVEREQVQAKGIDRAIFESPRCIIPTSRTSYLARDVRESVPEEKKPYVKAKVGKTRLFNQKALDNMDSNVIFVSEGEIDAMSVIECGGECIGLGSASNAHLLIEALERNYHGQYFIILPDADEAGKKAADKLLQDLKAQNIPAEIGSYEGKDPNAALMADREAFKNTILSLQASASERMKDKKLENDPALKNEYRVSHLLDHFRNIEEEPEGFEAKTGFEGLDVDLSGGLHEGLYVIGAESSLGKTTLVLQIADQVSEDGQDVLFFSLEMSKYELMAKSISRNSYMIAGADRAKDTQQIFNNRKYKTYSETDRAVISGAIEAYASQAKNLYIHEGTFENRRLTAEDIKTIVARHTTATGKAPLVIVDYLQILAAIDPRKTDKAAVDESVFKLKEVSRLYKIPVIAISSFNRETYKKGLSIPVNMASFKESGSIEYSSDVLIGLQFEEIERSEDPQEVQEAREAAQRNRKEITVILKCLKNRNGYKFARRFKFLSAFNVFREEDAFTPYYGQDPFHNVPIR